MIYHCNKVGSTIFIVGWWTRFHGEAVVIPVGATVTQKMSSGVTGVFAMDMKMKPRKRSTPPTATVGNSPMHPNIGV